MEKRTTRYKPKNKKPPPNTKPKTSKKQKSDGNGPSCSMFLADLTRKLASKKKHDESKEMHKNIVQTIIESITNALPVRFSRRAPSKVPSPMKIETLQTFAPELLPNNTLEIGPKKICSNEANEDISKFEMGMASKTANSFKMPKMPLVNSDVIKIAVQEMKLKEPMRDEAVNTGSDQDVATTLAKHVNTLRKISLIAEEFNQKTAKNLKEIVDSVQDDLIKKLEALQAEQDMATLEMAVDEQNEPQIVKQPTS